MTNRTDKEIIEQIKELIDTHVKPGVAHHGGDIEFLNYDNGHLLLELRGACSGCSGSTMTLKMGVENMIKHYVPEVVSVDAQDDPFSTVDPFYTDPFMYNDWDNIEMADVTEEGSDEPNN